MKRLIAALVLGLLCWGPAMAQSPGDGLGGKSVMELRNDEAKALFAHNRYEEAAVIWKQLAEAGNPKAMNNLGNLYFHGQGVAKSDLLATTYWKKAAEQGVPQAQFALAHEYMFDGVLGQDIAMANTYFRQAAAQDFAPALYELGVSYDTGRGMSGPDYQKAYDYYVRAAAAGDGRSAYNAAQMAMFGEGIEANADEGLALLERAAELKDANAYMALGFLTEKNMVGGIEAKSAYEWYRLAEAGGHPMAKADLERFQVALWERDRGMAQQAYAKFQGLCVGGNAQACAEQAAYLIARDSGIDQNYSASIAPLETACAANIGNTCEMFAQSVLMTGAWAGQTRIRNAERIYEGLCEKNPPLYRACWGVSYMNFYSDYGLNNQQKANKNSISACFNGGIDAACEVMMYISNSGMAARNSAIQSRKSSSGAIGNFVGGLLVGLVSGAADYASTGSVGSSSGYSGSSSSASSSSTSTYQSDRDFRDMMRATNSIGTAYQTTCRPGNPYC